MSILKKAKDKKNVIPIKNNIIFKNIGMFVKKIPPHRKEKATYTSCLKDKIPLKIFSSVETSNGILKYLNIINSFHNIIFEDIVYQYILENIFITLNYMTIGTKQARVLALASYNDPLLEVTFIINPAISKLAPKIKAATTSHPRLDIFSVLSLGLL